MDVNFKVEPIELRGLDGFSEVKLLPLTHEQEEIINPLIPPTSGIRMLIFDRLENGSYIMKKEYQYMFLRVFRAVAEVAKIELKKDHPNVLLVSDDRPSAGKLVEYCSKVFTYHEYNIFFQEPYDELSKKAAESDPYYSRMGTPYASCSLALIDKIDLVIVLTASHNSIVWNGVKVYIRLPFPISGRVMKQIAEKAISYEKVFLSDKINPQYIDADKVNNDYILDVVNRIMDISVLKGKKIVFWPFMGSSPEIQSLMRTVGVDLVLIDEDVEPPNPTDSFDRALVERALKENNANIAILMDADRDRIVFLLRNQSSEGSTYISLTPNQLYTAMHNLLVKEFGKTIINVRTVPSDPRSDDAAPLNIITGVGYKHLGMVIFSAVGEEVDEETIKSAILYLKTEHGYEKLGSSEKIREAIGKSGIRGDNIIMVLWEESGGHTFNILKIEDDAESSSGVKITPIVPVNGDKYPAIAILVLCALIETGHDLTKAVDLQLIGTRTEIHADEEMKVKLLEHFASLKGQSIQIGKYEYTVHTFEQIDGTVAIILLKSRDTEIYVRPSGTGPSARIYVYGPGENAVEQMNSVKDSILSMF